LNSFVIDASVAVKWVVEENGTTDALAILKRARLAAPDLLMAECANILWKKVQRNELLADEAILGARLIQRVDMEIFPMRQLLESATRMAIELDHPAYDCVYLALALTNDWLFVTADDRFVRKLRQQASKRYKSAAILLAEAAADLA